MYDSIAEDFNKLDSLLNQLFLYMVVNTPTRGDNIFDVFITNIPLYWSKVKVTQSLARSDNKMIVAYPPQVFKGRRTYSHSRNV